MSKRAGGGGKKGHLGFVLLNFGTPIVFFWTYYVWGTKPAIAFAIGATLVQALIHLILRLKFSPFFIVASGFTVAFGAVDLLVQEPRFFRLGPFAENFLLGLAFLATLLTEKPIAAWFAAALPPAIQPDLSKIGKNYLRRLTQIWAIYFFVKAFLFLYLAFRVNLGQLIVLRSILGGGSLVLMFVGELFYRKRRWGF